MAACNFCLEELHPMPAAIKSFQVVTTGGFLSLFNEEERGEIVQSVRDVNTVILRVTKVVDRVLSREFDARPYVNIEGKAVNPLIEEGNATYIIRSCVLPWSFR